MNETQEVQRANASEVTTRSGFDGEELSIQQDSAAVAAAAAAAKAEIEAAIVQAMKVRRNVDQFRQDLLLDCKRPGFAATAIYRRPAGRKQNPDGKWEQAYAEGFSIRFIEAALQHFMNVQVVARVVFENGEQLKLGVGVVDVQRNTRYYTESVIDKLVERKEIKQGRVARGARQNSAGQVVYLVEATRDEIRNLVGAERSKLIRDNGKRLLPPDVLDECWQQVTKTLNDADAKDPTAARKKVCDSFAELGVSPVMLAEYLGQPIDTLTPRDLSELRALYTGLKEGDFTWNEVTKAKAEPAEETTPSKLRDIVMNKASFDKPDEKKK